MSENTNISELVYVKDPTTGEEYVNAADGLRVVKAVVTREDSKLKGAIFHIPQYDSLGVATERCGEDVLLDAINAVLRQRVWQKFANRAKPDTANPAEIDAHYTKLLSADPVIGTVQEALDFKLGEREASLTALGKQVPKVLAEMTEASRKGDLVALKSAQDRFAAIMAKFAAAQEQAAKLAAVA